MISTSLAAGGAAENAHKKGFFLLLFNVLGALFLALVHVVVMVWLWYWVIFKRH